MKLQELADYPDPAATDVEREVASDVDRAGNQILQLQVLLVHRDDRERRRGGVTTSYSLPFQEGKWNETRSLQS